MDNLLHDGVQEKMAHYALFGQAICAALNDELGKTSLGQKLTVPGFETAEFSLQKDSFSGEDSLHGIWRDRQGQRVGMVIIHANQSFHAEYDVIKPHPAKRRWFVESVTAWGNRDTIKTELRLLPVLS